MSSEVKANKISPATGTDVTLGDASDTFTIPASATLDVNGTIDVTGATVTGLSAGKVLQVVTTKSQALVSSTSLISYETDTPYANTQGVEMLTATITPNATANRLVVVCSLVGTTESGSTPTIALWQDSDTNAIAAANSCTNGTDSGGHIGLIWEQAAGTTSATTFKIRGGPHSASTLYMNGRNAGVKWGGVPISTLQIWEIEA